MHITIFAEKTDTIAEFLNNKFDFSYTYDDYKRKALDWNKKNKIKIGVTVKEEWLQKLVETQAENFYFFIDIPKYDMFKYTNPLFGVYGNSFGDSEFDLFLTDLVVKGINLKNILNENSTTE